MSTSASERIADYLITLVMGIAVGQSMGRTIWFSASLAALVIFALSLRVHAARQSCRKAKHTRQVQQ
jgi:hypothetical protein